VRSNNVSILVGAAAARQLLLRSEGGNRTALSAVAASQEPRCVCEEGFAGARCGYAAFAKLRSGGAACNVTNPCGGEGSSCVRERCVCGRGWLGARCSFAGFSVLSGKAGGAACNSSADCGGAQTGSSCLRSPLNPSAMGRCVCGPGRVGARCAYAAFGMLEGGGGSCNVSSDCGGVNEPSNAPAAAPTTNGVPAQRLKPATAQRRLRPSAYQLV
jgi:hypothetical protein